MFTVERSLVLVSVGGKPRFVVIRVRNTVWCGQFV
jgi:hypothetical protein